MNKYLKSSINGIFVYLLMLGVYYGMVENKPNEFLLTVLIGPFIWVPLLTYPGIILLFIYFVQTKRNKKISSNFISSSIIFFGLGLIFSDDYLKNLQGQKQLYFFTVASVSCFIGFIYATWITPNKVTAADEKSRSAD